jgi:hypothetical protein
MSLNILRFIIINLPHSLEPDWNNFHILTSGIIILPLCILHDLPDEYQDLIILIFLIISLPTYRP